LTIAAIAGRLTLTRLALLGPLLIVAGYLLAVPTIMAAAIIGRLVLFPMRYIPIYDGLPYTPAAAVLGLLTGYLAAVRLDRTPPTPAARAADPTIGGHTDVAPLTPGQPAPET